MSPRILPVMYTVAIIMPTTMTVSVQATACSPPKAV